MQAGVITALEAQKRNKERVNIYLDGEYAFSLTLIEASRLRKGQVLSSEEIAALRNEDEITRTVERALRFLGYRPRSTAEVRRNLVQAKTPEPVVDFAIERLQTMGYLDDAAFARFWIENRETFRPSGPAALRYELRQKGVADMVIETVLQDMDAAEAAYRAARSKVNQFRGSSRQQFKQKIGNFLQRRGFAYSTSRDIIQQLMDEISEENPDYFITADTETDDFGDTA